MTIIFKQQLEINDISNYQLPKGAEILCVQMQNGVPCIWFKCDNTQPNETRSFIIYGTGHPIKDGEAITYIGTFQLHHRGLVFHVFEWIV